MEGEAFKMHKKASEEAESRSEVEAWPIKETQDHYLLKMYMVGIFWVDAVVKTCKAWTGCC